MCSDDEDFIRTPGIRIHNDRNQKDLASVEDNEFSGMESDSTYPNVLLQEYKKNSLYAD